MTTTIELANGRILLKYEVDLLAAAAMLHGVSHGSWAGSFDKLPETVAGLEWRLKIWTEPSSSYDLAVKTLCQIALEEYSRHINHKE